MNKVEELSIENTNFTGLDYGFLFADYIDNLNLKKINFTNNTLEISDSLIEVFYS
jgi:hypothetical protein